MAVTSRFGRALLVLLMAATGLLSAVPPAAAATLPAGFTETLVTGGLSAPTAMEIAPDGRIFVTQQTGAVRVIKNGALLQAPFVSLSVDSQGERGLLGIAFHPNFATNGWVYVYYTVPGSPPHNRVSRFVANGDVAAAGETIIMELENLSGATNHNGGAIHFGPDGKLYVAVGENANGANSQTLNNRLGKILRINADGTIPTDNPFFASASGVNRSIWSLGLRNPYTFTFQPGTSRMFINDVGQSAWEEINDGIAGSNYGWPTTEGPTTNPSFRTPLFSYGHGSSPTTGCAITGGAFYNPATVQFPPSYAGKYFFADFCSGWVRTLDPANIPSATNSASAPLFISGLANPVDLKVTPAGSLLILTRGNGSLIEVKYPPPPTGPAIAHPTSTRIVNGNLRSGSAASLAADDNAFFQVNTASGFKTSWYAQMTNIPNTATNLRFTYSGSNSVACAQTLQAFNFTSRNWVNLDTRNVGPTEVAISDLAPPGAVRDFVSRANGLGNVRLRVICQGSRTTGSFFSSADLVQLSYTG